MEVEGDKLKRAIQGAVLFEGDAGLLRPYRCTRAQLNYFNKTNETWADRAHCSAGIHLAWETDATHISFDLVTGKQIRPWASLDVVCDGVLMPTRRVEPIPPTWHLRIDLPPCTTKRELRIYLPYTCETALAGVRLAGRARANPVPAAPHKLLCLGDSITQGVTATGAASSYPIQVGRRLQVDVLNQGIGGHIFDANSFDKDLPFEAHVVTIAYGTNDWAKGMSADTLAMNARTYIHAVRRRYPRIPLIVVTPLWRTNGAEQRDGGTLLEFSDALRKAVEGHEGVAVIDGNKLVAHREDRFSDGLHPNDTGFAEYAAGLIHELRKILLAQRR